MPVRVPPNRVYGEAIFINQGNVGIGTFAPKERFHVYGPAMMLEGLSNESDDPHVYIRMQERGTQETFAMGCDFKGSNNRFMITAAASNSTPRIADAKLVIDMAGHVGIGTVAPTQTLHVQGNTHLVGDLVVTGDVRGCPLIGDFSTISPYGAVAGLRTIVTNDTTGSNLVLYSFSLPPGRYLLNGNVPFTDTSDFMVMDNLQWATVALYEATPATFDPTSQPLTMATFPRVSGATSNEVMSVSYQFLADTTQAKDYVIAVVGKGNTLVFQGDMHAVPIRGIGIDDEASVRQSLAIAPIRSLFTPSNTTSNFQLGMHGAFFAASSNVDVYRNGAKLLPDTDFGVVSTYDSGTSNTTFAVTLQDAASNVPVDITVHPAVASDMTYYKSGYLYQNVNVVNGALGSITSNLLADQAITPAKVQQGTIKHAVPGSVVESITSTYYTSTHTFLYDGLDSGYAAYQAELLQRLVPYSSYEVGDSNFYCDIRAVDTTNNVVLGSASFSNDTFQRSTIPLSNLPSAPAVFELQVRKGSVGTQVLISAMQWGLSNTYNV